MAQSFSTDARPLPRRIIVKVRSAVPTPADRARTVLAPISKRFGIGAMESWLHPGLLLPSSPGTQHKGTVRGNPFAPLARILVVRYSSTEAPEIVARAAGLLEGVEYAEPMYPRTLSHVPNDPQLGEQWYLDQVGAKAAWDVQRGTPDVLIAVTDAGIDPQHPDLKNALFQNPGETGTDAQQRDRRTNVVDDDGNGLVDDWAGYDFGGTDGYTPDNDATPYYWHGTHVAGIAAASGDNGVGIAGVAYGAQLLAIKITDDALGDPLLTKGQDGILYAARMGAKIINCSWGGPGYSRSEQELIDTVTSMGSLVVAAAGNNGAKITAYPASYRNVISVAALIQGDRRSNFSNYNERVGIAAPGENIYSTAPVAGGSYRYSSGTSMAAPIVAGAAALVALKYPDLTPEQIAAVLRATSDDIDVVNPDYQYMLGSGRVNVARALNVGPSAIAVAVLSMETVEDRPDGVIESGEGIAVRVTVKNILSTVTDLRAILEVSGGTVPVTTPEETFGVMNTGEIRRNTPGTFYFVVPSSLPLDYRMQLKLTLASGITRLAVQSMELTVNPNYATTALNRTQVTFTGNGRIAFNDFPINAQGNGFRLDSMNNLLAEGGVLIGRARDRLADVVRAADFGRQSDGLQVVEPYRLQRRDNLEEGHARFNDAHLSDLQRIGIDVELRTLQYLVPGAEKTTFVLYRITNTSGAPIDNLHCALYLDWDIGQAGGFDRVSTDLEHRLGYTRNTQDHRLPFTAAQLLGNQPMNFTALDNGTPPLTGGFLQVEKWNAMANGILREESDIGDCSMMIGAGPIALGAGADTVVAFALMAGSNLADLKIAADEARERFAALGYTPGDPIVLPTEIALRVAEQNPFTASTVLEFSMPRDGFATLELYDMRGALVTRLAEGQYRRGIHRIRYAPQGEASGMYVARLRAFSRTLNEKLIRIAQ